MGYWQSTQDLGILPLDYLRAFGYRGHNGRAGVSILSGTCPHLGLHDNPAQHLIVSEEDLSKVNLSFFTMNGLISMVIFVATILSL